MPWQEKVAHKITRGYLKRRYQIEADYLRQDPPIQDLPFFNPVMSSELRRNELRIVAGRMLRFFLDLNIDLEGTGYSLDDAFGDLVDAMAAGTTPVSETGVIVDKCFKCVDD